MQQGRGWQRQPGAEGDPYAIALAELIVRMRSACAETREWPERVGAALYAAVDFFAEERRMALALLDDPSASRFGKPFRNLVHALSQLLEEVVPVAARPGPNSPAAAIAGAGLVVGDCVRWGRLDRLPALCPELHLMILLPYLGFEEAKLWAEDFPIANFPDQG